TAVAGPRVTSTRGRLAVERGPIVHCAEWPDVEEGRALDLWLDATREMTTTTDAGPFGGATLIHAHARRVSRPSAPSKPITLIPYSLWANRGAGEMTVWLSAREYEVGDVGPSG